MENLVTGLSRDANRDAWPCPTDAFFTDDVAWQRLYGHLDATFATAPAVFPTTTTECCVHNPPRPCFPNSTMGPAIGLTMRRADADASRLRRDPHAATPACGKDGTKELLRHQVPAEVLIRLPAERRSRKVSVYPNSSGQKARQL